MPRLGSSECGVKVGNMCSTNGVGRGGAEPARPDDAPRVALVQTG